MKTLSEKRNELLDTLQEMNLDRDAIKLISTTLEKQDKEFIQNLKWNLWEVAWVEDQSVNNKIIQEEINKLAGDKLI